MSNMNMQSSSDSFPPGEREWLMKTLLASERRQSDRMLKLYDLVSGLDNRLEAVECSMNRTGKKAAVNATLNGGAIISLIVTVLIEVAQKAGWM